MVNFVNKTGHDINLNNGTVIKADPVMTSVDASYGEFDENGICQQVFGEVKNLPEKVDNTIYIVSAITLSAVKELGRTDFVAPATGHPNCVRTEDRKRIISVPGFVR